MILSNSIANPSCAYEINNTMCVLITAALTKLKNFFMLLFFSSLQLFPELLANLPYAPYYARAVCNNEMMKALPDAVASESLHSNKS